LLKNGTSRGTDKGAPPFKIKKIDCMRTKALLADWVYFWLEDRFTKN
jgi:hypothetical protein